MYFGLFPNSMFSFKISSHSMGLEQVSGEASLGVILDRTFLTSLELGHP